MESQSMVSVLEPDSGSIRWRKSVAGVGERLQRPVAHEGHLFVPSETRVVALRLDNGNVADAFDLDHTASTAPLLVGDSLVFGTPQGLVYAQHAKTGLALWEYKMAAPIEVEPVRMGRHALVADSSGQVALLDPGNGRLVWRTANPPWEPIVAQPAGGDDLAYVASRDQKLYAFGRFRADVVWRYLTERPLTESPTLIGNRLFQPTKSRGLVCLDAETGQEKWRADVSGRPLQTHRDNLGLLHENRINLTRGGELLETVDFPGVDAIRVDDKRSGNLYLVARDGRVMRLAPRR
jgi:outer membrane protein assembly factor BamB